MRNRDLIKPSKRARLARLSFSLLFATSSPAIAGETKTAAPLEIYVDDPSKIVTLSYLEALDWAFFRTSTYCYATLGDMQDRLFIGYNHEHDQVHVGFWSSSAPEAPDRSGVDFSMIAWKRLSDGSWAAKRPQSAAPMVAYRNNVSKSVYNVISDGRDALSVLIEADRVEFRNSSGAVVGSFSLHGSASALRRLETCTPR